MTREDKGKIIDELAEKFSSNQHYYITDAGGFTVEQINAFRKVCFQSGVEYGVYKNTLIKKALERNGAAVDQIEPALHGFSGVMFSREAGNLPARVIKDFRKKIEGRPVLKAASIDSEIFLGDGNLNMLSELKSKNELIGEIVSILQSPAKNVLSALLSGKGKVAGIVKALEERKN